MGLLVGVQCPVRKSVLPRAKEKFWLACWIHLRALGHSKDGVALNLQHCSVEHIPELELQPVVSIHSQLGSFVSRRHVKLSGDMVGF